MGDSSVCYLCGDLLHGDVNADHVPMRQLFGKSLRAAANPDLLTLQTHYECNHAYQLDEEYFVNSLAPVASDSLAGGSVFEDISNKVQSGKTVALSRQVLAEFDKRPSGLHLPEGLVIKRLDSDRIRRVLWKITRGLHFHEFGQVLPEETPHYFRMASPGYRPPEEFFAVQAEPGRGRNPGVFDYKYKCFPELDAAQVWALLFWDRLIVVGLLVPEDAAASQHLTSASS